MTRVVVDETQLRSPLPLVVGHVLVACFAIAAVAYGASRAVGCITLDTCPTPLANCNDDRNVRSPCVVPNITQSRRQLQTQPTASDPASGTKSLGPIRDILGSRPGSLAYNPWARVVGPVASPVRSRTSGLGSLAVLPVAMGLGSRYKAGLVDSETTSPRSPGPFSVINSLLHGTIDLVGQDTGTSLPQREFESRMVLQRKFSSAVEHRPDKPGVVGSNPSTSTTFTVTW